MLRAASGDEDQYDPSEELDYHDAVMLQGCLRDASADVQLGESEQQFQYAGDDSIVHMEQLTTGPATVDSLEMGTT